MKNIILINSLGGGGAERQVINIMQLEKIENVICINPFVSYSILSDKLIFLTSNERKQNKLKHLLQLTLIPFKLLKLVNKKTHLICFLQLSTILGFFLKKISGCTLTITVRTNPWAYYKYSENKKIPFAFYRFILESANYVVANSKETTKELNEKMKLKNKAKYIPNGFDITKIESLANEKLDAELDTIFKSNKILITVGRLFVEKGHWHLLRIFNQVKKNNPNTKLFILGQGVLINKCEKLCSDLNLSFYSYQYSQEISNNFDVYFLGFTKNPFQFIKRSYLFLFPSLFEGLPNSPIEAMICETPTVLSNCASGPKEILFPNLEKIIENEKSPFGILIPAFDGHQIWDNSQLVPNEQIWVDEINMLLKSKAYYELFKQNFYTFKINNSLTIAKKYWETFLGSNF
jgi:glycosyltransferase involved in cell wall biosynthesis